MKELARSALLMAALSIGGCATAPVSNVTAPAWVASSTASKQQIWGVYDGLAGTTWSAPNSYVLFYRWAVPGQVLVEEFRHPTTGELAGTNIIVPGSGPGSLVLTSSIANMQWHGTLDANGNVLFARDGIMRMPSRVSRTPAGELLQEKVTLDGTVVTQVDSSTTYTPAGSQPPAIANPLTSPVKVASPSAKSLVDGEWIKDRLDESSQQTSFLGRNFALYTIPAKEGETVTIEFVCQEAEVIACNNDTWVGLDGGRDHYDKVESRLKKTYLRTARKDDDLLRIETGGTLHYQLIVATGAKGQQIWATAQREEAERQQVIAEREAAESAENARMFGAVMTGLSQGLAEGAADYQASQDNQAALLNGIAQTTQAAQAQQEAAAYEVEQVEDTSYEASSNTDSSTEAEQDATVAAALAQARQMAEEAGGESQMFAQIDEAQQLLAEKKARRQQQAGTNKILPSKIQLSTATNSITPSPNLPEPVAESSNMAQGKVRLCNRPGDEGPAHWPTCPQTRAEEAKSHRLAASGGDGSSEIAHGKSSGSTRTETGNTLGGSGDGSQNTPSGKASTSDDEPFAWCTQNKKGFKCWGPYGPSPYETSLKSALGTAGCGYGEGDPPDPGETTRFDCNIKRVKYLHGYVPESPPDWK
ncbi:hypothetical protein [Pseudomonas sp. BN515]|uniref:hypothetical protein n=1 Tax=Pseudomonas sp. BN515 TaxID=2567892 RepID=UPI002456803E|nr:hypothetical protein [Pseudomonas sp. BN515]MDH4872751.1 hypothetical protein [Pseudomonas sp. BN515]